MTHSGRDILNGRAIHSRADTLSLHGRGYGQTTFVNEYENEMGPTNRAQADNGGHTSSVSHNGTAW